MIKLEESTVESALIKEIDDLNRNLKIGATINTTCCPGNAGFASQVLLTIMSRLEDSLGIIIPHNVYIFHDKVSHKQLSIKEAANKLIRFAKDGK